MKSGSNSFALSENASTTSKLQSQSPIAPYLPDNFISGLNISYLFFGDS